MDNNNKSLEIKRTNNHSCQSQEKREAICKGQDVFLLKFHLWEN